MVGYPPRYGELLSPHVKEHIAKVRQAFLEQFGSEPALIASGPGRVNVIGEHVDYMGGFVLPVAIDREVLIAARPASSKDTVTGYSLDFKEKVSFKRGEYDPKHPVKWLRYVLGVLKEIEKAGLTVEGFDFCVSGNVPQGSGLSSSAALELATLTTVLGLTGHKIGKKEAALLCQRAENEFVGVNCGIMDQYISSAGLKDNALRIDCADLSYEAIEAKTPGHTWLVIDSKKKRGLVDSEYNQRRAQCNEGLAWLQASLSAKKVGNLRDVTPEELKEAKKKMDPVLYKRVKHVISENIRVTKTCDALRKGDLKAIGENLYASHASLKDDFEVSCAELDALVDIVSKVKGASGAPAVVGARLTGAGFGGCAIALVADSAVAAVTEAIASEYPRRFPSQKEKVEVWPIRISDGAKLVGAK
jgi:galactokinase